VVGPCIGLAAYEVGPEFQAGFLAADPSFARFFCIPESRSRAHFDLPGFMLHRLQAAGIGHASWVGACTYTNPEHYFSFRRATHLSELDYGRQIAVIMIPA
jgi:polyphenol oxidase